MMDAVLQYLLERLPHGHPRIKRPHGVLEDHLDEIMNGPVPIVAEIEFNCPRRRLLEADERLRYGRLPGSGLADYA